MRFQVLVVVIGALASATSCTGFTVKKPGKAAGCVADLNSGSFPEPDPVILRPGVTVDDIEQYEEVFVLPSDQDGMLRLDTGETVRVACPGNSLSQTGNEEELVTCKGDNKYQIGTSSSTVTIDKLRCKSSPSNDALRKGDTCAENGIIVQLGFELDTIYPLIYTCFNEETMQTYWSKERVVGELKGYESGEDSPSFREDDFYPGLDVDELYKYDSQVVAFTKLLGSKDLALKYLKDRNNYFLARGHFAPRADFVFGSHTRATYHFVNCNPQWQVFNGGVWNNLEMAIRDFAISSRQDFIGYTGPYGVLELADVNNNMVEMYLANPGTNSQTLAVPQFYWKILYEPQSQKGVAFVGINNPYVEIPYPKNYQLCPDVLSKVKWLNIKNTTWLYACEVNELTKLDSSFPQLEVSGLLTE